MVYVDISSYKNTLLQEIYNTETIVKAINSKIDGVYESEPDSLIYKNIFPFIHIRTAQNSKETYILLGVDQIGVNGSNSVFCDLRLTIVVLVHNDLMKMRGVLATRADFIANELRKLFNGSNKYGFGKLDLISSQEDVLDDNYQYRKLLFRTTDLRLEVGDKND